MVCDTLVYHPTITRLIKFWIPPQAGRKRCVYYSIYAGFGCAAEFRVGEGPAGAVHHGS